MIGQRANLKILGLLLTIAVPVTNASPLLLETDPETKASKLAKECENTDKALKAVKKDKAQTEKDCVDPTKSQEQKQAAIGEKQALNDIEKKLEEERLKILFVDVNTVYETIGSGMDWTANWLDGMFADDEAGKDKAKAWGHVIFAWEPREGQVVDSESFPVKFRVKAKLPNLENKVEIILSDGEDDDFETLPYESVKPEALRLSQSSLGAAVQFLSTKSKNVKTSSRIGIGDSQIYLRSSATYRNKYWQDKVTFSIQPALEYYASDGWGGRGLVDIGYKLSDNSEMRFNFSLRDRESFDDLQFRNGIYNVLATGDKSAWITGYTSSGEFEAKDDLQVYTRRFSTRYRFNALRKWIFIEIEPFVEFIRDDEDDRFLINPADFRHDFVRDRGITIRFEGHYGFL